MKIHFKECPHGDGELHVLVYEDGRVKLLHYRPKGDPDQAVVEDWLVEATATRK